MNLDNYASHAVQLTPPAAGNADRYASNARLQLDRRVTDAHVMAALVLYYRLDMSCRHQRVLADQACDHTRIDAE